MANIVSNNYIDIFMGSRDAISLAAVITLRYHCALKYTYILQFTAHQRSRQGKDNSAERLQKPFSFCATIH